MPERTRRERIISFDESLKIVVTPADAIERSIYLFGYHEYAAATAFAKMVRPGMTVVDAGAHAGQFTLIAARRAAAAGRVFAIEPHPAAHARLVRNLRLNGFKNVTALTVALSDAPGPTVLHVPQWAGDNTGVASLQDRGTASDSIEVEGMRLDDVLRNESRFDVLKADVEGAEARLFAGAQASLKRWKPAIIFEANDVFERGALAGPAVGALRELGYDVYGIDNAGGGVALRRLAHADDPRRFREPWQALNLVALHPDRAPEFLVNFA
ncbi:MAG: FkbM family methyltransferase [Actinomycetota bacterium]|nr:FkbM family methyltransferase [Actinomycetota bacterium]